MLIDRYIILASLFLSCVCILVELQFEDPTYFWVYTSVILPCAKLGVLFTAFWTLFIVFKWTGSEEFSRGQL